MERDELLIEAVRDYPCLYNSKSADFKVLLKKENAWTAIAARLERTGEQLSMLLRRPTYRACSLCVLPSIPQLRTVRNGGKY